MKTDVKESQQEAMRLMTGPMEAINKWMKGLNRPKKPTRKPFRSITRKTFMGVECPECNLVFGIDDVAHLGATGPLILPL